MKKIKEIISYLTSPARIVWKYFADMNSESKENGGGVSIKRNMAWGIGTLAFIVELYSLYRLPCKTDSEIKHFVYISIVYVISDLLFVCLALSITTFEKITDLIQRIKGGIITKQQSVSVENDKINKTENTEVNTQNQ